MIRSLVIRQSFLVIDAALFILVLATGAMVVMKFIEAPAVVPVTPLLAADAAGQEQYVRTVAARDQYNTPIAARLFGDAGAYEPGAAPVEEAPAPEQATVAETELNLRLIGTTATETLATAIIEDGSMPGSARSFGVSEVVVDNVTLEEVHPRHVIIRNKQNGKNQTEKLSMDDQKDQQVASAAPTLPAGGGTERKTLNRQELMQDLMLNYQDLVTKVKPELYRDASGKVVGVTASNIGQLGIAQKLGIQDGDVLQTVNNENIDSEAKIFEMVTKYQNASSFRIGILRNGKPTVVTYRLE